MPNILIVMCLRDDDDGEMREMSRALELAKKKKAARGDVVHCVELRQLCAGGGDKDFKDFKDFKLFRDFKDLNDVKGVDDYAAIRNNYKVLKAKQNLADGYDQVIFTGHGRFFTAEASLSAIKTGGDFAPGGVRPIAERRVGGYGLPQIIPIVEFSYFGLNASSVVIFSCESALTVASYRMNRGGEEKIVPEKGFTLDAHNVARIRSYMTAPLPAKVSTVQLIALGVMNSPRYKGSMGRAFEISGMNGVGFISPKSDEMITFDQDHLAEYAKALQTKSGPPRSKALEMFEARCVQSKRSPHILVYTFRSPEAE